MTFFTDSSLLADFIRICFRSVLNFGATCLLGLILGETHSNALLNCIFIIFRNVLLSTFVSYWFSSQLNFLPSENVYLNVISAVRTAPPPHFLLGLRPPAAPGSSYVQPLHPLLGHVELESIPGLCTERTPAHLK